MSKHLHFFQVAIAKDTESENYWIDFNIGSGTLKFFVEEKDDKVINKKVFSDNEPGNNF